MRQALHMRDFRVTIFYLAFPSHPYFAVI